MERNLGEVLDTMSRRHLEALLEALQAAEGAEVDGVLAATDTAVVHYRRGRASMIRELVGLIRATLESRRPYGE